MITFENVITASQGPVSFHIARGFITVIETDPGDEFNEIKNTMLGLSPPRQGRVSLLGKDLYSISEEEYVDIFREVGVVLDDGGLISNLKVWENLILPATYHDGVNAAAMEKKAGAMFGRLGIGPEEAGEMMRLAPGELSSTNARMVRMVRAMLAGPDHMIYAGITEGLRGPARDAILSTAVEYHRAAPGRTSVFLTASAGSLAGTPVDAAISIGAAPEGDE